MDHFFFGCPGTPLPPGLTGVGGGGMPRPPLGHPPPPRYLKRSLDTRQAKASFGEGTVHLKQVRWNYFFVCFRNRIRFIGIFVNAGINVSEPLLYYLMQVFFAPRTMALKSEQGRSKAPMKTQANEDEQRRIVCNASSNININVRWFPSFDVPTIAHRGNHNIFQVPLAPIPARWCCGSRLLRCVAAARFEGFFSGVIFCVIFMNHCKAAFLW